MVELLTLRPEVTALAALVAVLLILASVLLWQWSASRRQAGSAAATAAEAERKARSEIGRLTSSIRALEASVDRLAKYELVADAEAKAAELVADAERSAGSLREEAARAHTEVLARAEAALAEARARVGALQAEADAAVRAATADADRIRTEAARESDETKAGAREDAKRMRASAEERAKGIEAEAANLLTDARGRGAAIVAEAQAKAETLAGDALRALQQAEQLERTVQAMKNTIEGYGDRYLIPSHTLLDDLAEEFGHAEAGQKLKAVRHQIRQSVNTGRAAACDYAERNRSETAIRFVVDAFNGKADSILSEVKHNNAGTLQQELRDAFSLVNLNGRAFRNARITDEYLALRLEELHWAAVANELRVREREEQRRIKEQIREEEKARKEYERAMREAARDEDALQKAMDKATAQLAKASEEQKARYEAQLLELSAKLKEAEERSKRALSMAQQTKQGHVYIISNVGSFGQHVYKIGLTRRLDPLDRVRELGDSSVPFEFDVHAMIFAEDAPALETQLHRHFVLSQVNNVNYRKEFFRVDIAHIRKEIEALGLTASWTMAAQAREYRESLAIEKLIEQDPAAREAWLRRQLTYEAQILSADDEAEPAGSPAATDVAVA